MLDKMIKTVVLPTVVLSPFLLHRPEYSESYSVEPEHAQTTRTDGSLAAKDEHCSIERSDEGYSYFKEHLEVGSNAARAPGYDQSFDSVIARVGCIKPRNMSQQSGERAVALPPE